MTKGKPKRKNRKRKNKKNLHFSQVTTIFRIPLVELKKIHSRNQDVVKGKQPNYIPVQGLPLVIIPAG